MKKNPQIVLQARVEKLLKDENALLTKHKLAKKLIVSFPTRRHSPLLGRLGMWLVRRSGGIIDTLYTDAGGGKQITR